MIDYAAKNRKQTEDRKGNLVPLTVEDGTHIRSLRSHTPRLGARQAHAPRLRAHGPARTAGRHEGKGGKWLTVEVVPGLRKVQVKVSQRQIRVFTSARKFDLMHRLAIQAGQSNGAEYLLKLLLGDVSPRLTANAKN